MVSKSVKEELYEMGRQQTIIAHALLTGNTYPFTEDMSKEWNVLNKKISEILKKATRKERTEYYNSTSFLIPNPR